MKITIVNYDVVVHHYFLHNLFLFQMMSSAKRLCTNAVNIRYQWHPIVDDDYLRLPQLQSMIVGRVRDRRLTDEILSCLNQIYPWPNSLKHVRRLHQIDNQLDILLYPTEHSKPIEENLFLKYFQDQTRMTNIPLTPCLLKWQYDSCIKDHWSNLAFRRNDLLEKCQLNRDLTEFDQIILDLFKKMEEKNGQSSHAIIVDNTTNRPLVGCGDYRTEHPLQHPTMVAIDYLSSHSNYHRENLLEGFIENTSKEKYLLNNCSIYLTNEPCIMCSMALLHSRIENVYYIHKNVQYGSLGSIYKLHSLKKTNHRFNVYHLNEFLF